MDSHAQIAADAIGSVRAEGLEPGITVIEILDRWVDGQIETEQLGEAARALACPRSSETAPGDSDPAARAPRV
jgi:hypothetical protein